jgi:hypothetical protein
MTTKPVTQTAEVEVKRASTKRRFPLVAEKGNQRRIPPVRITAAKLRMKILAGEKCLEKNVLILIRIFIGIERSTPPIRVRMDFTQRSLFCQPFDSKPDPSTALKTSGLGLLRVDPERRFFTPP